MVASCRVLPLIKMWVITLCAYRSLITCSLLAEPPCVVEYLVYPNFMSFLTWCINIRVLIFGVSLWYKKARSSFLAIWNHNFPQRHQLLIRYLHAHLRLSTDKILSWGIFAGSSLREQLMILHGFIHHFSWWTLWTYNLRKLLGDILGVIVGVAMSIERLLTFVVI